MGFFRKSSSNSKLGQATGVIVVPGSGFAQRFFVVGEVALGVGDGSFNRHFW